MERYNKIKTIGKGTFGSVNLVERIADGKRLAIKKIYLGEACPNPKNETQILETLHHPNIITYYESFIYNNKFYIVTDYAAHGDLSQLIKKQQKSGQYLSEEYIYECLNQIVSALVYLCDKKILHRDIKTQNILLDDKENVIIGDFGISKQLSDSSELAQTSLGTPYYLSPEICRNQQYDHKTDMWMLGCVLYEMLTFKKPFQGESLNAIINNILYAEPEGIPERYDKKLHEIVKMLLTKNQEERINIYELQHILKNREIDVSLSPDQKFNLDTPTTHESDQKKKKKINKISIVTQNLQNLVFFLKQQFRPGSDKQGLLNMMNDEFAENRPKSFSFGKTIFDSQTPTSPQRQILFQEFLKKRLGENLFHQSIQVIMSTQNPIHFLENNQEELLALIGAENREMIKAFKMLFLQPQPNPQKRFNFINYRN